MAMQAFVEGSVLARINQTSYQVIIWLSALLPFPFVLGKLWVRHRIFKKLFVDDFLVVFAWMLLISWTAVSQAYLNAIYTVVGIYSGTVARYPGFQDLIVGYARYGLISSVLMPICLWSIKLSFLVFFRRLTMNVEHQRFLWWCITLFTVACFGAFIGQTSWKCLAGDFDYVLNHCNNPVAVKRFNTELHVRGLVDVMSDIAILITPFSLLWKVGISLGRKVALGCIFSLTLFTMISAMVRAYVATTDKPSPDLTWQDGWAGIEMGVSVLVACIATFRVLFSDRHSSAPSGSPQARREDAVERYGLAGVTRARTDDSITGFSMSYHTALNAAAPLRLGLAETVHSSGCGDLQVKPVSEKHADDGTECIAEIKGVCIPNQIGN